MNIKLKNIGIIKYSDIKVEGLTIITGQNNSGKTTIGKALYSSTEALLDIQYKAYRDRKLYIRKVMSKLRERLSIFRTSKVVFEINENELNNESILYRLFYDYKSIITKYNDKILIKLREELLALKEILKNDHTAYSVIIKAHFLSYNDNKDTIASIINHNIDLVIYDIEQVLIKLNDDPDLINYTRESLSKTLRVEFRNQIQPIKTAVENSYIEISNQDIPLLSIDIHDNKVKEFTGSAPFGKVHLIDNPFIMDMMYGETHYDNDNDNENTLINKSRIKSHEIKLNKILKFPKNTTVLEDLILNKDLEYIRKKINEIIPGEFDFSENGNFYVEDGKKLDVSNLATGSKMFSIIKILLEKGEIDDSTLLILDEPEAHLHPSWQNKFAEIIVMLVKYLKVKIILTSHSPNFVLAIDAFMRKYEINDITNFYQTQHIDDYFVEYVNVNDDIGKIYYDFIKHLSEVKMLRNKYTNGSDYD